MICKTKVIIGEYPAIAIVVNASGIITLKREMVCYISNNSDTGMRYNMPQVKFPYINCFTSKISLH